MVVLFLGLEEAMHVGNTPALTRFMCPCLSRTAFCVSFRPTPGIQNMLSKSSFIIAPTALCPVRPWDAHCVLLRHVIALCLFMQVGFSTSLGLLQRNGADIDKFMGILRGSALYAPTFDKKLQRMLDRDYANPNFPTKVSWRVAAPARLMLL